VQLVSGTEVAVAPKRHKKATNSHENSNKVHTSKALLRVQDANWRLIHRNFVKSFKLSVVVTSIAFVHPEISRFSSASSCCATSIIKRWL